MNAQQPSTGSLTAKELSYLTDSMKNETVLTRLCVQTAVQSQAGQLQALMDDMGRGRLELHDQLLHALSMRTQQGAGMH